MLKIIIASLALAAAAFAGPCSAGPDVWNENSFGGNDAGGLPSNADITAGVGPLDTICGNVANATNGVDMYEIDITGGAFTATASDRGGSTLVPALFLFDSSGNALYGDENGTLSGLTITTPGLYFLAITSDGNGPLHGGNEIFNLAGTEPLTPVITHTKIDGWDAGGGSNGQYLISLTNTTFAQTPEPATLGFVGAGLLGLGFLRRRSR